MRNLQRLNHVHRPAQGSHRLRLLEAQRVARRENRIWSRRIQVLSILLLIAAGAYAAASWIYGLRTVASGIVEANQIFERASVPVRVARIFCRSGQRVERGDVLMTLQSMQSSAEREALAKVVEQRKLRLDIVAAGGALNATELGSRTLQIADAKREAQIARADHSVARAELDRLERERDARLLQLEKIARADQARIESLRLELDQQKALLIQADAVRRQAERDAGIKRRAGDEGLLSKVESQAAVATEEVAALEYERIHEATRRLQFEIGTAQERDALDRREDARIRSALEAQVEQARQSVAAARVREEHWRSMEVQRNALFPHSSIASPRLAQLELELLRAELEESEALLRALDERIGNMDVVAGTDGIVEQVFVQAGSVVETDAPLVRYYDPETQAVMAYVDPAVVARLELGQACRIVPASGSGTVDGEIASIGRTWIPSPRELTEELDPLHDPRVLVTVVSEDPEFRRRFGPNSRVKVVLPKEGNGEDR